MENPWQPRPKKNRWISSSEQPNKATRRLWGAIEIMVAKGHADARFALGQLYLAGQGVPQDEARALELFIEAARGNHPEALKKVLEAAEQGNVDALLVMGRRHLEKPLTSQAEQEALGFFVKAAQKGNVDATYMVVGMAGEGHADAQFALGQMYLSGQGVFKDEARALNLFIQLARSGHAEALKEVSKAADKGKTDAQFALGQMYLSGQGVHKDEARALKLFIELARSGHAEALAEVSKAADKGNADALLAIGKKSFTVSTITFNMVYIPPGGFLRGSPATEPERFNDERQHQVRLAKGFWMGETQVIQGLWQAVMGNNPSHFKNCGSDCPVECMSWDDCQKFIECLNVMVPGGGFRLPTEAEWEYAARAGTTTPFHTGNCLDTDQANYEGRYPLSGCPEGEYRGRTVKVASFAPNAWGLYDMHGNVWEWIQDRYGDYPSDSVEDPTGPLQGASRVLRGGSWYHYARICRSAYRSSSTPDYSFANLGLRLARTL